MLTGRMAVVVVRCNADIAAVTRGIDRQVVAESVTDAVQTADLWTFSRMMRSGDPNWILVKTDVAA